MANNPPLRKEKDKPKKEKSHDGAWWQKKCDGHMQDIGRMLHQFCEVCGSKNEVGHHFITKSLSSFLRYEFRNLVPLCHSCHFKHHISSDPSISATIIAKRGMGWFSWIESVRRNEMKMGIGDYKKLHYEYKLKIKQLNEKENN